MIMTFNLMDQRETIAGAKSSTKPSTSRTASRGILGAAILSGLLLVGCASHTVSNISVAEATAVPDGTQVVVTGEVVQQVDREHLLLRDGSGQINVTVDEDILGKVKFAPDSRLRILGKVDRNSERSVLIATSVQVVQQ
jgi:uncharacterized protein (TIGR00156 family)